MDSDDQVSLNIPLRFIFKASYSRHASCTNVVANRRWTDLTSNDFMKLKDKKLNLLRVLYSHRFDGQSYDVLDILKQFGPTNRDEAYSITKALHDEGLVKMTATKDGTDAEIISYGVEFIEDEGLHEEPYEPTDLLENEEKEAIKKKLDEFSERLKRMEVGQQITYDDLMEELETLKKLLNVLGKKDWGQILKGKLVDAGFGQLADKVGDLIIETFKDDKLLNG